MTHAEKLSVMGKVKPTGGWKSPKPRSAPWLNQPVEWENKIGDLDEWRDHEGQSRKILALLKSEAHSESVASSVQQRLRKLNPDESWICSVESDGIYLKFNGIRRHFKKGQRNGNRQSLNEE